MNQNDNDASQFKSQSPIEQKPELFALKQKFLKDMLDGKSAHDLFEKYIASRPSPIGEQNFSETEIESLWIDWQWGLGAPEEIFEAMETGFKAALKHLSNHGYVVTSKGSPAKKKED